MQFVVARAPHIPDDLLAPLAARLSGAPAIVLDGHADDVLQIADVALVASGTVTVQAALHECPMVVVYRLSPLTYRLGRPFVRVSTFAMANLVAGSRVVPELIQDDFTPESVAAEALDILTNPARAARMRETCGKCGCGSARRAPATARRRRCSRSLGTGVQRACDRLRRWLVASWPQ